MSTSAKDIGRLFSPLQIGSIVDCVEPLSAGSEAGWALELLAERPELEVVPIERDGAVLGVVSRHVLEGIVESAWKRFWQKDLDAYVVPARRSVEATDYVDRIVAVDLADVEKDDPGWYIVNHRRAYLGIVNLRTMLEHLNHLRSLDLRRAGEMQKHLLSKKPDEDPRFRICFYNRMAHEIGGDFYRSTQIGEDRWLVACFDVAGKNISGALATSALGAIFACFKLFAYAGEAQLTTGLLNALVHEVNPGDVFVAAALFYLDMKAMTVEIHNCGFSPVLAFIPQENRKIACKMARPNLPPLGIEDRMVNDAPQLIPITPGLRLTAYSDGLTDMTDPFGERYGEERTIEYLRTLHKSSQADIPGLVGTEVDKWIGESHLADDITLVDLRFL
ncbi:MAG: stage II sporulation protein E [Treponema sp. GWB1_62_6]|nr:MAG: stage II sporulation protein E [Treponema sp. GWB1_62_6]OHE67367.1 MAG: stage II sporulation protein E [Treponema sp. GWC1_61_84]OHE76016.1 MAG: stage II sporulation protein E [Treponema sp. RIFOXYC1_FULL_61_9]HCM27458.1 stage II sporulation protein E [Treponema sp.]